MKSRLTVLQVYLFNNTYQKCKMRAIIKKRQLREWVKVQQQHTFYQLSLIRQQEIKIYKTITIGKNKEIFRFVINSRLINDFSSEILKEQNRLLCKLNNCGHTIKQSNPKLMIEIKFCLGHQEIKKHNRKVIASICVHQKLLDDDTAYSIYMYDERTETLISHPQKQQKSQYKNQGFKSLSFILFLINDCFLLHPQIFAAHPFLNQDYRLPSRAVNFSSFQYVNNIVWLRSIVNSQYIYIYQNQKSPIEVYKIFYQAGFWRFQEQ